MPRRHHRQGAGDSDRRRHRRAARGDPRWCARHHRRRERRHPRAPRRGDAGGLSREDQAAGGAQGVLRQACSPACRHDGRRARRALRQHRQPHGRRRGAHLRRGGRRAVPLGVRLHGQAGHPDGGRSVQGVQGSCREVRRQDLRDPHDGHRRRQAAAVPQHTARGQPVPRLPCASHQPAAARPLPAAAQGDLKGRRLRQGGDHGADGHQRRGVQEGSGIRRRGEARAFARGQGVF